MPGARRGAPASVHESALRSLARRALSQAEMAERLARRGFGEDEVREEVRRLRRAGLLDDEALARSLVEGFLRQGYGRRALFARLRRRKLSRRVAEAALGAVAEDAAAGALQRALARAVRRYPEWRTLPTERRKMVRYLLTRGFQVSAVKDAMAARDGDDADAADTFEPGDPQDLP